MNLFDSTAIVIGSMIGSGIFIVSSDMARQLGSPGWLLVAWIITGLMTVFAAISYGELASMFPKAGGQYIYLHEAYNPLTGFVFGWTQFLVIQAGSIAAVAMAFSKFAGVLFPWISENNIWLQIAFFKFNTVHFIAILSIILLTYTNSRGIKTGKLLQNSFTYSKVFIVIIFIILGFIYAYNTPAMSINKTYFWDFLPANSNPAHNIPLLALIIAMGCAMVGSIFSADAWNNITFAGSEIINPKRTIPLSLFLGTLSVSIIYLLVNYVYINLLPLRGIADGGDFWQRGMQFASEDRLGSASITGIFGNSAAAIMAGFIVFSTFGCNNGLILAGARVYYAMSLKGLFFRSASKLNRFSVPANGLYIQGFWACLLCLSGTYSQLLDYVVFAVLLFYILTIAGIFILRIKRPELERPYKTFGYPVVPAIYILLALLILVILLIYKPFYSIPGLIIVLLGIPVYYLWKRKSSS